MKIVTIPFVGYVTVTIEDTDDMDDKALIDHAMEIAGGAVHLKTDDPVECDEWELMHEVVRGNVFYGHCAEASVDEYDD